MSEFIKGTNERVIREESDDLTWMDEIPGTNPKLDMNNHIGDIIRIENSDNIFRDKNTLYTIENVTYMFDNVNVFISWPNDTTFYGLDSMNNSLFYPDKGRGWRFVFEDEELNQLYGLRDGITESVGDDYYQQPWRGGDESNQEIEVLPSNKTVNNICKSERFCEEQGKITFGQLKALVENATKKRTAINMGEGGYKATIRLLPWFIPQLAIGGFIASSARALNKILKPTLTETESYKTWWGKVILHIFSLTEGEINTTDPLSKVFFISDGLMTMMGDKYKGKFAKYMTELASTKPDSEEVPEYFVENELRKWVNEKFLLDPPLNPKTPLTESEDDDLQWMDEIPGAPEFPLTIDGTSSLNGWSFMWDRNPPNESWGHDNTIWDIDSFTVGRHVDNVNYIDRGNGDRSDMTVPNFIDYINKGTYVLITPNGDLFDPLHNRKLPNTLTESEDDGLQWMDDIVPPKHPVGTKIKLIGFSFTRRQPKSGDNDFRGISFTDTSRWVGTVNEVNIDEGYYHIMVDPDHTWIMPWEGGIYVSITEVDGKTDIVNESLITEKAGISFESRKWADIVHGTIIDNPQEKTRLIIDGYDYPEAFEDFPIDYVIIDYYDKLTGYGQEHSGYDKDGNYIVLLYVQPALVDGNTNYDLKSALNHEFKHAWDDYNRLSKGRPSIDNTRESKELYNKDFIQLLSNKQIVGPIKDLLKYHYYLSNLERTAYLENVYDGNPTYERMVREIIRKDFESLKDRFDLDVNWHLINTAYNIPLLKRFKSPRDFINYSAKDLTMKAQKMLKKINKMKFVHGL